MSETPKSKFYSFGLRGLFAIVTLVAILVWQATTFGFESSFTTPSS